MLHNHRTNVFVEGTPIGEGAQTRVRLTFSLTERSTFYKFSCSHLVIEWGFACRADEFTHEVAEK